MNSTEQTPGNLTLTRVFNAPRALVFEAWTDPKHLAEWWGPHAFTNARCEWDFRPGGKIHVDMQGPEGTVYPMVGECREIVPPERLVFTAGALDAEGKLLFEILNTVTFAETAGKTTLTLQTELLFGTANAQQYLEGQKPGWAQSLERLENLLAKGPLVIERMLNASPEQVWTALTDKVAMKEWYFDLKEFRPEVGFEFAFVVEHEGTAYDHRCRITEVIPGRKIAYSWRYEGHAGDSLVTFQLTPEGEGTWLKLTHEGTDTFEKRPEYARGNFSMGWTSLVTGSLPAYLARL